MEDLTTVSSIVKSKNRPDIPIGCSQSVARPICPGDLLSISSMGRGEIRSMDVVVGSKETAETSLTESQHKSHMGDGGV